MGPTQSLLDLGATIVALARPASKRAPKKWSNLLQRANASPGTMLFPTKSADGSIVTAGCDALTDTPEIINWLISLNKQIKVNLNIRFHPQLNDNDRKIIYNKFNDKISEFVNVKIDNLSLNDSLKKSSYVFSEYFSTVIEDATEQGKKTICFRTNNENFKFLNKNISSLIYFLNIDNNDSSNLNSIKFEHLTVEFQSMLKIKNAI